MAGKMTGIKPDQSTAENREYWQFVAEIGREVQEWPTWKRPTKGEDHEGQSMEASTADPDEVAGAVRARPRLGHV